jgi:hypothetical protein
MDAPYYIILDVEYDPDVDYGRSLKWIAPELAAAEAAGALVMTEDYTEAPSCADCDGDGCEKCGDTGYGPYPVDEPPSRKWAGVIDAETYERFAHAWSLADMEPEPSMGMLTEYGLLADNRYHFDGMDWNAGGLSPIVFVSLSVSIPANEPIEA